MIGWWQARGVLARDGMFALTLAALAFAPGLADNGVDLAELPHRPMDTTGIALGLGQCLPLVLRRRASLVCLALVAAVFVADQLSAYPSSFGSVGLLGALYAAGAYLDRRLLAATLATAVVGYLGLCLGLHALGSPELPVQYLTFFLVLAGCWTAGQWMRAWWAGAETRRVHSAQLAVAEERTRIARELHDVVTHHVTAMVVQSDASQFLLTGAPDRAADGLTAISDTGRRALAELRGLLDVLDDTGPSMASPAPAAIDDLVARIRSAGQPVRLVQRGNRRPDTPDGVALAVYRVVQEALTNAVKHAPGRYTVVQVDYAENDIIVQIVNEQWPDLPTRTTSLGGGRGIAGLRARVAAVGGKLSAEPGADGGFVVRACLPLRADP
jgi:signal transduction histidine kinase